PDASRLASGSSGALILWDVATRKVLWEVRMKDFSNTGGNLAINPDNRQVAYDVGLGDIRIHDFATGRLILTLGGHTAGIAGLSYSPDGRRIASASEDRTVKLWDTATGHEILTLRGHTSALSGVAFSRDGRRLASTSADGTVRIWDATPWIEPPTG